MPRWKALPDELDPQVGEFAGQLRRLVDRSGLSVSAVADRTGYSKTSWDRYLNGRLLAPKGAVIALAEVTGTNPVHLTTMWELAERAWSRSEMRHDMTMEAIRISQARAALGEFGPPSGAGGRGATAASGVAGPAGVAPVVPSQPTSTTAPDAGVAAGAPRGGSSVEGSRGRSQNGRTARAPEPPVTSAEAAAGTPGTPAARRPAAGGPPPEDRPSGRDASDGARRRRPLLMFLAGVIGALAVIAVAFFLTGGDGTKAAGAPKPSASAPSPAPDLPAGVKCAGAGCTGKDPENMGCGGTLAKTSTSVTVGTTLVEVRYSETCGAAWARVTRAAQGDTVTVSAAGAARQTGSVAAAGDTDAYTPMVSVTDAAAAKACVTLTSGQQGCTK
ncbi:DUF2690 domain-containing protein [Streptomyces sp. NPDC005731]|uniref:XRE family transcriptional regulator n=1 Tax=Streptomyces sp. NPDC005731 TaxID=3157056 RepID=UPI0033D842CD